MSKSSVKHMSADGADKFEESIERQSFGSIDDWETELGLTILKIRSKINKAKEGAVTRMLRRKLVTYNAALRFLDQNPKSALIVGSEGGVPAIIAYLTKQATQMAAREETDKYSKMIMAELPGYKIFKESSTAKEGGLVMEGENSDVEEDEEEEL